MATNSYTKCFYCSNPISLHNQFCSINCKDAFYSSLQSMKDDEEKEQMENEIIFNYEEEYFSYMNEVLSKQFSEDFVRKMKARVFMGFHRYGESKKYKEEKKYDILKTIEKHLRLYNETGNAERLVDAANYLMIEFMHPQHPNAHFVADEEEDAEKRIGIVETLLRVEDENKKGLTE
jgi:hypothetical protein